MVVEVQHTGLTVNSLLEKQIIITFFKDMLHFNHWHGI